MKRDDAPIEMRKASSFRTICEVHREIHDACGNVPKPLQDKLRGLVIEAFEMGKKMDKKLRDYKADWDLGFYQKNRNWKADRARRK